MSIADVIGGATGRLLAPLVAEGTRLRNGRLFHPHGTVWAATVTGRIAGRDGSRLADRLSGRALVRLSRAFFAPGSPVDLLGCAIRFRGDRPLRPEPAILDQDLLFATVRRPWIAGLALALTDVDDYLANTFWTVSPFRAGPLGRVRLRLVPARPSPPGESAETRLAGAVRQGDATLNLELGADALRGPWRPLAEVRLEHPLTIDEAALAFSPFRTGAGIEPAGFVQRLRRATYRAAQHARRELEPPRATLRGPRLVRGGGLGHDAPDHAKHP